MSPLFILWVVALVYYAAWLNLSRVRQPEEL